MGVNKFENSQYPFAAFVTNLGKYNEGELMGEWVAFPTTKEKMDAVLEKIGVGIGEYQEYFLSDYDCYINGLSGVLGEHENLSELNYLAGVLTDEADIEKFSAAIETLEHTGSLKDAINLALSTDSVELIPEAGNDEELGRYLIENEDRDIPEWLTDYVDYEAYGRDAAINAGGIYVSAGFVKCNDIPEEYDGRNIPEEYRLGEHEKDLSDSMRQMRDALDKSEKIVSHEENAEAGYDEPECSPRI